tara:strand:- start:52342 stop:53013 length:672 start_codon:yes stop_codon:yes gene_type:complete
MNENIKIDYVDPASLSPNTWNSNIVDPENEAKIEEAMDRFGMFKPILVREKDGKLEILGGEHRVTIAARKGMATIPIINLGDVNDTKAKEIGLVDNGRYGTDDVLLLNNLLQSLDDKEDMFKFLPYSSDEMDSIFASSSIDIDELSFDEDDDNTEKMLEPDAPPPPQTHQIMRFKVSIEDSDRVMTRIDQIIGEQGFDESDSLTNAGDALVHLINNEESSNGG